MGTGAGTGSYGFMVRGLIGSAGSRGYNPAVDPKARKKALRRMTYGLYVLTAAHEGELAGATITWLSQASFEPPLVMASIRTDSEIHAFVERSGAFAVNLLDAGQKEIASAFFKPAHVADGSINGFAFEPGPGTGAPVLADAAAWFEARVTDAVKRGDHSVFIAEVVGAEVRKNNGLPLVLRDTGWSYGG